MKIINYISEGSLLRNGLNVGLFADRAYAWYLMVPLWGGLVGRLWLHKSDGWHKRYIWQTYHLIVYYDRDESPRMGFRLGWSS